MNDVSPSLPNEGSYLDSQNAPDYNKYPEGAYCNDNKTTDSKIESCCSSQRSCQGLSGEHNNQVCLRYNRKMNKLLLKLCEDYSQALQYAMQMRNDCIVDISEKNNFS